MTTRVGLQELQTVDLLQKATYVDGTDDFLELSLQGNSLLSSVFVESADPGATIEINYYQVTTGNDATERMDLRSHPPLTVANAGETSQILVTNIHDKPRLEFKVSGGDAVFGVYGSLVTQFPVDLTTFLENSSVNLAIDAGLPIMLYDDQSGSFNFLRGSNGNVSTLSNVMRSGLVTEVTLNSVTWTPLPASIKSGRKVLSIQNESNFEMKVNHEDPGSGVYVGMVVPPQDERIYTMESPGTLYGLAKSGTPKINVEELSIVV